MVDREKLREILRRADVARAVERLPSDASNDIKERRAEALGRANLLSGAGQSGGAPLAQDDMRERRRAMLERAGLVKPRHEDVVPVVVDVENVESVGNVVRKAEIVPTSAADLVQPAAVEPTSIVESSKPREIEPILTNEELRLLRDALRATLKDEAKTGDGVGAIKSTPVIIEEKLEPSQRLGTLEPELTTEEIQAILNEAFPGSLTPEEVKAIKGAIPEQDEPVDVVDEDIVSIQDVENVGGVAEETEPPLLPEDEAVLKSQDRHKR